MYQCDCGFGDVYCRFQQTLGPKYRNGKQVFKKRTQDAKNNLIKKKSSFQKNRQV